MVDYITKEQARIVEENHYKKYGDAIKSIKYFINKNYNLESITDFICKLNDFEMTKDLLRFKNYLQVIIKDDDRKKVYLVYFALKEFIRTKRLEILYKMRDNGVCGCIGDYPHWRIWDAILNTKWKYMNKSYNYDSPIIDKYFGIEYENVREASTKIGINIDFIKDNFGYDKRYAYISDFRRFQDRLPISVICPPTRTIAFNYFKFPSNEHTFDNIEDLSDKTGESIEKLKKYIDKDYSLFNIYTLRTVSYEEQFRLYNPVIINNKEYYDISEASDELRIPDSVIAKNINKTYIKPSGKRFDIRSKEDESFVTEDKKYPFDLDKKFAYKMLTKLKEIRNNNSMKQIFFP